MVVNPFQYLLGPKRFFTDRFKKAAQTGLIKIQQVYATCDGIHGDLTNVGYAPKK